MDAGRHALSRHLHQAGTRRGSWPSSTAILTIVPCIGLVTESPLAPAGLNENERKIWSLLSADEPIHIDTLLETSGLSFGDLNSSLVKLDLKDLIRSLPGNFYARKI